MIAALFETFGPWHWIVGGLILGALELIAPGVFLIWLGLAAVVTGVAMAAFGLSWQASAIVFAVLAVASVIAGRSLVRHRSPEAGEQPFLNRRGEALVGRTFTLDVPILKGEGKVKVGDSFWRVTGPDMVAGAKVRVTAVEGSTLVVESA
jgi:membrane protein implicated in regulation of membrane protease activity